MALLVFPTSPFNGQVYPPNPLPGQSVYQWDATEQTWRLLGAASGVTSGTYGDSLNVGQFTVDGAGRITAAQNVPIQKSSKTQLGVVQIGNNINVDASTGIISIPFATSGLPGVVIVGSNLSVTAGGILSVPNASTTTPGAVQLVNNTVTNDPSKALTAAAGFTLQQQINALVISNNLTFAGTINGATGLISSVTPEGTAVGFAVGQPLPLPTTARDEYFVVVSNPGTFTPTGSSVPVSVVNGDWFVAIDGVWTYFNVGVSVPFATTTVPGIVELSTNAETQAGTSSTLVVTPASLSSRVSTEANTGLISLATQAEVQTGVNDNKAVTPLKLGTYVNSGVIQAANVVVSPPLNGEVNVQDALQRALYDLSSSGGSLDISEVSTGLVDANVVQATETQLGGLELATQSEVNAGTNDDKAVTPLKLAAFISSGVANASGISVSPAINGTTNVQSVLENALYNIASPGTTLSVSEAATGLISLDVVQATETQLGGLELATQAEVQTGTNDSTAVTPLKLATYINSGVAQASNITVSPAINGGTNIQSVLENALYNIASPGSTLSISEAATGLVSVDVVQATETQLGGLELATQAEVNAGTDASRALTPLTFSTFITSNLISASDIAVSPAIEGQSDVQSALNLAVYNVTSGGLPIVVDATDPKNLVVSVNAASTAASGVVQLNNTTSNTSDSLALTAAQGKVLQDQINTLAITNNLIFAGTLNASTGNMLTVTSAATLEGFSVGSPLPAAAAANTDFFAIVTVPSSSYTPPGGTAISVNDGDWLMSSGTAWQLVAVGFDAPYASTTSPGVVELSTNAETQAGTDATLAVTPTSLQSKISDSIATTSSTTIASSTAVKTAYDLADAALPKSGGTMTGNITFQDAGEGVVFNGGSQVFGISDSVSTASSTTAASSTAVKTTYDLATAIQFLQFDDISGSFNGSTKSFSLTRSGSAYAPNPSTNIMVFLGGVAQLPGATKSYTVTGSTITFVDAPPTGTVFYATTVDSP